MHDKIIVQMTEAEHAAFCIIQEHAVEFNNIERELTRISHQAAYCYRKHICCQ